MSFSGFSFSFTLFRWRRKWDGIEWIHSWFVVWHKSEHIYAWKSKCGCVYFHPETHCQWWNEWLISIFKSSGFNRRITWTSWDGERFFYKNCVQIESNIGILVAIESKWFNIFGESFFSSLLSFSNKKTNGRTDGRTCARKHAHSWKTVRQNKINPFVFPVKE